MKKIIIGVAGAAIAYSGASWYMGYQGEKALRTQFELSKQQLAGTGISYEIGRYDRGIFSSSYEVLAKLDKAVPTIGPYSFKAVGQVQHGPVLWRNGFGLGLMDYQLEPTLHFENNEVNQGFQKIFGGSLGEIKLRANFDKSYSGKWQFKPINVEGDSGKFAMEASEFLMNGQLDQLSCQGSFNFGAISFTNKDNLQGKISPMTGEFDVRSIEPGIFIYNYDFKVAESHFTNAMGIVSTLSQLELTMNQAINENAVDSSVKFALGKFSGPVEVSNGYYEVKLNKLSLDALRSWHKAYNEAMASVMDDNDPQAAQLAMMGVFGSELPKFLQKGLNLHLNLGAEFMGGKPNAHWEVNYVGPVDGKTLADLTNTQEYLTLADSDLLVQAPAMLLGALPMDQYVGSYVTQEGDDYVLKASLHNGALKVGTVDIPQEQLLAMAGAFVTGFQNSIAARSAPAAEDTATDASDAQDYEAEEGYEDEGGEESSQDEEQDENQDNEQ